MEYDACHISYEYGMLNPMLSLGIAHSLGFVAQDGRTTCTTTQGGVPVCYTGAACSEVVDFGWKWVAVLLITALYLVLTFAVPYHALCPRGYLGPGGTDCGPDSPWGHHASCDGCNATTGEGCPLRECTAGFMGAFDKAVLGARHLTAQGRSGSMCAGEYKCVDFDVRSCLLLPPPPHHHNNTMLL